MLLGHCLKSPTVKCKESNRVKFSKLGTDLLLCYTNSRQTYFLKAIRFDIFYSIRAVAEGEELGMLSTP